MRAVLLLTLLALSARAAGPVATSPAVSRLPSGVPPLLTQRTISGSKQFLVFCADPAARSQVASYTEEIKTHFLQVLGEADHWKQNIVITLEKAPAAAGQPAQLSLYQNEASFKIQIDVRIGSDPTQVNLQRLLVRALLLEFAYRDQPQLLHAGTAYQEAPWWLVEGIMQLYLHRDAGMDSDLFKQIIDVNRLPAIGKFLGGHPSDFSGSAVESMDQACAVCLLQLLLDQSGGRASLAALVRHWPQGNGDSVAALTKEFSGLAKNEQSLQKWWTLNLARFSAADRYKGLNSNETEKQLAAALTVQIATPNSAATPAPKSFLARLLPMRAAPVAAAPAATPPGSTAAVSPAASTTVQPYALAEFPVFLPLAGSKEALGISFNALAELSTTATGLYRPLVVEYQAIVKLLLLGKTHGLKARLAKVDQVHADLHARMNSIADYLNWVEATQTSLRSGKFDGYLKAANELAEPPPRQDPLSKFMDEIEKAQ